MFTTKISHQAIAVILLAVVSLGLLLTATSLSAAQLVDQTPSNISSDWSICVIYTSGESNCQNGALSDTELVYQKAVIEFVYKKQLIISSELSQSILGLWLDQVDETDEVRLNGFLIGKTGKAPPNFQSGYRYKRLYLIPSHVIKYNQFNQLEIKTFSSANRPGIGQHPVMLVQYLKRLSQQKTTDALFIAIATVLILLTLFQFYNYFMLKANDETIYLIIFLVVFTLITFTRSSAPLNIGLDLNAVIKTELFLMSVGFVAFIFFTFRFFELKINKLTIMSSTIISLVGILGIIYPMPLHLRFIYQSGYIIICLSSFFILGYVLLAASHSRRKYSAYINSICLLAWSLVFFDALSQTSMLLEWQFELLPWLLPLVAALVAIAMVIAVTHKYWQIFKTANYDHLTGMLLRPSFFKRLNYKLNQARDNSSTFLLVAVINIKELSHISSSFGLHLNNKLIELISQSIYKSISPMDLVCQFNYQEFCIAVNVKGQQHAEQLIKQLHQNLVSNQQTLSDETEIYIGAKIGADIYNFEQHQSVTQLLQDANYGLERAKNQIREDVILVKNPSLSSENTRSISL